ncbi:hypothetical protein KJA16_01690 [Patescibacteria group bacterium]|nr:hypothetical protein [Patescibacteria group bacterium]
MNIIESVQRGGLRLTGNLLNLMGRTAHAITGVQLLLEGRVKDSERYVRDFISIEEGEIKEAFCFLIPAAQEAIVKKFNEVQSPLKDDKEIHRNKDEILATLRELFSMTNALISLSIH